MILVVMLAVLIAGGAVAWAAGKQSAPAARWIALAALVVDLVLALVVAAELPAAASEERRFIAEVRLAWVPGLGMTFHLGADGLSLILVLLTLALGVLSVIASWREIEERVGLFHLTLLWVLAGVMGVFVALDLFLFFLFWEVMLVPMFFLIGIWGHENRVFAAIKFFLFTQASGLLMLLAILGLVFAHARQSGRVSFDYLDLLGTPVAGALGFWLMLGFFVAFAVKLPVVPLHTWLPDAHTEAPTAGSVVLAGLLLKTGGYGMLRFAVPLFPSASEQLAPVAMVLGVVGILYGALLAFAQTDLKRLVAYTSVSHLGFVLLGIYSFTAWGAEGAVVGMVAHGLGTGGLFIMAGLLQERLHTRELAAMGGMWEAAPRLGAATLILALASLGLPGLASFVGELLVLIGAFQVDRLVTVFAALGLVAATVYALVLVQRTFHGRNVHGLKLRDASPRELLVLSLLVVGLVWLGLFPQPLLDAAAPALRAGGIAAGWSAPVARSGGRP